MLDVSKSFVLWVILPTVLLLVLMHVLVLKGCINIAPINMEVEVGTEMDYTVVEEVSYWKGEEPLECMVDAVLITPDREEIVLASGAEMTKPNATSRHEYTVHMAFDGNGYWRLNATPRCRFGTENGSEWVADRFFGTKGIMVLR